MKFFGFRIIRESEYQELVEMLAFYRTPSTQIPWQSKIINREGKKVRIPVLPESYQARLLE